MLSLSCDAADDVTTTPQEQPRHTRNGTGYVSDNIVTLCYGNGVFVVTIAVLCLCWQLFTDYGRPNSFIYMMALDHTRFFVIVAARTCHAC